MILQQMDQVVRLKRLYKDRDIYSTPIPESEIIPIYEKNGSRKARGHRKKN